MHSFTYFRSNMGLASFVTLSWLDVGVFSRCVTMQLALRISYVERESLSLVKGTSNGIMCAYPMRFHVWDNPYARAMVHMVSLNGFQERKI